MLSSVAVSLLDTLICLLGASGNAMLTSTKVAFSKSFVFVVLLYLWPSPDLQDAALAPTTGSTTGQKENPNYTEQHSSVVQEEKLPTVIMQR